MPAPKTDRKSIIADCMQQYNITYSFHFARAFVRTFQEGLPGLLKWGRDTSIQWESPMFDFFLIIWELDNFRYLKFYLIVRAGLQNTQNRAWLLIECSWSTQTETSDKGETGYLPLIIIEQCSVPFCVPLLWPIACLRRDDNDRDRLLFRCDTGWFQFHFGFPTMLNCC